MATTVTTISTCCRFSRHRPMTARATPSDFSNQHGFASATAQVTISKEKKRQAFSEVKLTSETLSSEETFEGLSGEEVTAASGVSVTQTAGLSDAAAELTISGAEVKQTVSNVDVDANLRLLKDEGKKEEGKKDEERKEVIEQKIEEKRREEEEVRVRGEEDG